MSVKEGDPVPSFELPTDDGGRVGSASLLGRPYVIYFYPKDDTPGCTKEAISFSCLKPEFDKLGVTVIGVSKDDIESHSKFRKKHDLSIHLASDEEGKTIEAFGAWVEKSMYGKKYMGIERATFLVDAEGRIRKVWRNVKVPGHAEAVLEAAKALVSG